MVQYAYEVDELYEGLVAHHGDGAVQLILVYLLLAAALSLLADVAVVVMRGLLWVVVSLGGGSPGRFSLAVFGRAGLHFRRLGVGVLVLHVSVQRSVGAVSLAAALGAGKLLDYFIVFAPMYFLHIYYHQIVQINRAIRRKRHHARTMV